MKKLVKEVLFGKVNFVLSLALIALSAASVVTMSLALDLVNPSPSVGFHKSAALHRASKVLGASTYNPSTLDYGNYPATGPDYLGMDISCYYPNLSDCEKQVALIKNLGVSWTRWSQTWYSLMWTKDVISDSAVEQTKQMLGAIRQRGMKIDYIISLEASPLVYSIDRPASPSLRLDFDDEAFSTYLDNIIPIVAPYTSYFELGNELNWGTNALCNNRPNCDEYVKSRIKQLYALTQAALKKYKSKHPSFNGKLLSSGISYFYDAQHPAGVSQPANLIEANKWFNDLNNSGASLNSKSTLKDDVDIVSIHPYFGGYDYSPDNLSASVTSLVNNVKALIGPSQNKPVWATETALGTNVTIDSKGNDIGSNGFDLSGVKNDIRYFHSLNKLHEDGKLDKIFWYLVQDDEMAKGASNENKMYALYNGKGDIITGRANLVNEITNISDKIPYSSRFDDFGNDSVLYDVITNSALGSYYVDGYGAGNSVSPNSDYIKFDGPNLKLNFVGRSSVKGDFLNINIPKVGVPVFKASISAGSKIAEPGTALIYIWIGNSSLSRQFQYSVSSGSVPKPIEIDLTEFRGQIVNLSLSTYHAEGASGIVLRSPQIVMKKDLNKVIWSSSFSPSPDSPPVPIPAVSVRVGQLINNNGTVYLVSQNGLYGFPDLATFNSWGYSFSQIVTANSTEVNLTMIGLVPMKSVVCASPLDQINGKCPVANSNTVSVAARVGAIINLNGTIYLVGKDGLYGFPDLATFNSWGYSFSQIVTANSTEVNLTMIGLVPIRSQGCSSPLDQIGGTCSL